MNKAREVIFNKNVILDNNNKAEELFNIMTELEHTSNSYVRKGFKQGTEDADMGRLDDLETRLDDLLDSGSLSESEFIQLQKYIYFKAKAKLKSTFNNKQD